MHVRGCPQIYCNLECARKTSNSSKSCTHSLSSRARYGQTRCAGNAGRGAIASRGVGPANGGRGGPPKLLPQ